MGGEVTECAQAEIDLRWTGRSGQSIMALQQACGLALACNWYLRINYCYDLTNGTYTFDPILGRWTQRRQSLRQAWLTWCIPGQPALHIETLSFKRKEIIFCLGYISAVECLFIIQEALGSLPNITRKTQDYK